MEIIFEAKKGQRVDIGESFKIVRVESDNITIGRSPRKSDKSGDEYPHMQISSDDIRLSRWHFMVQVRPPNCFIYDTGSSNHTYVNDFKKGQHIKGTVELKDGDIIKAGRTYLKVRIMAEEPKEAPRCHCTRCGKELKDLEGKHAEDIGAEDFICEECRKRKPREHREHRWVRDLKKRKRWPLFGWLRKERLKREDEEEATVVEEGEAPEEAALFEKAQALEITCFKCGQDITERADKDGRADELSDVALYLCEDCAPGEREKKEKIGDYLLLKEIGVGGMGVVYEAWHKRTGRVVGLKELLPDKLMDEKNLKVFHREISISRDLIHPNIVRFYDSFSRKRKPYLVTEYLPGGNAEDRLLKQKGPFPIDKACRIILEVLEGLSYANERGIVHRDVKPQNILFDGNGKAKLSDMGLAKSFELAGQSGITAPGEIGGTILYMAPEQILDFRFVKPPADVYSIGVCLYYFLTGKFPYEFPSSLDALLGMVGIKKVKHPFTIVLEDEPIPILERKPDIPKPLASIIDRCLRKRQEERFRDGGELKGAISGV